MSVVRIITMDTQYMIKWVAIFKPINAVVFGEINRSPEIKTREAKVTSPVYFSPLAFDALKNSFEKIKNGELGSIPTISNINLVYSIDGGNWTTESYTDEFSFQNSPKYNLITTELNKFPKLLELNFVAPSEEELQKIKDEYECPSGDCLSVNPSECNTLIDEKILDSIYYTSRQYRDLYNEYKSKVKGAPSTKYDPIKLSEKYHKCRPWLSKTILGNMDEAKLMERASSSIHPEVKDLEELIRPAITEVATVNGISLPITGKTVLSLVENKSFLDNLRRSDIELLRWKRDQYLNKLTPLRNLLRENEKRIAQATERKLPDNIIKNIKTSSEELIENILFLEHLFTTVEDRLKYLGSTPVERLTEERAISLRKMVSNVERMKGEQRRGLREAIYNRLVIFASSPALFKSSFVNNFMLLGGAGVGKSTAAAIIADALSRIGLLETSNVVYGKESNLIGQYVGQTAPRMRQALNSALGGVIFIDEAYALSGCPDPRKPGEWSKSYGREAMDTMVDFMSENSGLISIIVAGYPDKMMKCFLPINEGLPRRFGTKILLPDYSAEDLYTILNDQIQTRMNTTLENILGDDVAKSILRRISSIISDTTRAWLFKYQAGDMQNLADLIMQDFWLNYASSGSSTLPLGRELATKVVENSFNQFIEDKNLTR